MAESTATATAYVADTATATVAGAADAVVVDASVLDDQELLVEDVSIDGMCGVY